MIEVGDQSLLLRLPSELRARQVTRRRIVGHEEGREETELLRRLFSGHGDHRNIESPTDHIGDRPERYAFIRDCMVARACDAALQREPESVSYTHLRAHE